MGFVEPMEVPLKQLPNKKFLGNSEVTFKLANDGQTKSKPKIFIRCKIIWCVSYAAYILRACMHRLPYMAILQSF